MPATTPKPKQVDEKAAQNGSGRPDVRFVYCNLSAGQKSDLKGYRDSTEIAEVLKWIGHAIESGVVISLRANETGFQCSGTGTRASGDHPGQCLVARASNPINALYSWVYKDHVLLKHKWPEGGREEDLDL